MAKEIVTKEQKQFLELFKKDKVLVRNFYLSGGTALALFYYGHRLSEDLDFFSPKEVPITLIEKFVKDAKAKLKARQVEYVRLYDRQVYQFKLNKGTVLKVEFTLYPFKNLRKPKDIKGIFVDGILDIGANKIMSILNRFEPKDFFDLYFIKKDYRLENLRTAAQKKFGISIDPLTLATQFSKVKDLKLIPYLIKTVKLEEVKEYFGRYNRRSAKMFLI